MKRFIVIVLGLALLSLSTSRVGASGSVDTLLAAVTTTGASAAITTQDWAVKGFQIIIAATATVDIEISNDGVNWFPRTSSTATAWVASDDAFVWARANVTACTGCTVTVILIRQGRVQ